MPATEALIASRSARDRHTLLPCEIYQAWQAASQESEQAFRAWCAAGYGRKADAYAVYLAASDREDAAAEHWLAV